MWVIRLSIVIFINIKGAKKGQNNCYFLDMFNLCNNQKTA